MSKLYSNLEIEEIKKAAIAEYLLKHSNILKNHWVPCCEAMPPQPLFKEKGYIVQQYDVDEPFSAYWNGEYWTDTDDCEIDGIIAWQPLPKRYEGK